MSNNERKSDDDSVGEQLANADIIGGAKAWLSTISMLPVVFLTPLLRVLPASWRLYHKMHLWSAWQMQQAASADALANVRTQNDNEDVLPAKWVEGDGDDRELTGWKVMGLGEKRFDTGIRGGSSSRFGKADIIHINGDDLEQGSWAEAAIDNAIAANREQYLFRDAKLEARINVLDGNGAARTDGGQQETFVDRVTPQRPGVLEDMVVDLTSEGDYDGQQVSWNQVQNLKQENTGQEKLREAKNAGWMAAKLDDVGAKDLFKWVLVLGAIGAILLFHQEIGALIAGGGGDAVSKAADGTGLGMILPFGGV